MADYSTSEVLNEMARIFRARLTPGREGGTLNTQQEYNQLLEIASLTLLLQNDAIFYLAFLASNRLSSIVNQEINLIEDILVSLEDLSQIGEAVEDTATLANASTALLTLDSADSVGGRPETIRFTNLMDRFAEQYRKNVVSQTTSSLVRPKEDARNIIQVDLERLKKVHDKLLTAILPLRDILDVFVGLDIPSKVSTTALTSVRQNLDDLSTTIDDSTSVENIARSRRDLLTTLASKSAVRLISEFTDPRTVKIRSPKFPIPSTAKHFGRVTGEGDPASVISGPGPWDLPVSSASLDVVVNGGATQGVPVGDLLGSVLNGRNKESFIVSAADENLHVVVDPTVYRGSVLTGNTTSCETNEFLPLGFKHLGASINFPSLTGAPADDDYQPRAITDLTGLQIGTVSGVIDLGNETYGITFSGWAAGAESGVGLAARHIGSYLSQANKRFEILAVGGANIATVSVPTIQPTPEVPVTGAAGLRGHISSVTGEITFTPDLTINASGGVQIGAAVKTVKFTTGTQAVSDLIDDVENLLSNQDLGFAGGAALQTLNHHVRALPVAGDPTKLSLTARSFANPYIQISSVFPKVAAVAGTDLVVVEDSAHDVLGFREGELDTNKLLTASELAGAINDGITSILAEVIETELGEGTSLSSAKNTATVTDAAVDFNDLVITDDQIEILTGFASLGTFRIVTVSGSDLVLDRNDFPSSETGLRYRLFREQVKISTVKKTLGSSIEVTSGPAEMGFTSGEQLGSIPQFEAVDKLGNKLTFTGVLVGDLLRLVGSQDEFPVEAVQGVLLVLEQGLPSDVEGQGFEIRSRAAKDFEQFNQSLATYIASPNLLKKNGFDEDLDAVDAALTRAVLPGQNFASNRNQAKLVLGDLLSIMTSSPRRGDEYTAAIPTAPLNLETLLLSYLVAPVVEVDRLIESFEERRYNRAIRLLTTGKIDEFYETTEETGSFGGAILNASKSVDADLPASPTAAFAVDQEINLAVSQEFSPDADQSFEDTEDVLDIPE